MDDSDAPGIAAANAAWDEFLLEELGDLQLGLQDELVLLRDEADEDEYVVALADCISSGHRGLLALTTRRLVFVTRERRPSPAIMTSVPLGAVGVVEADDDAIRVAGAGGDTGGDEYGGDAFSHTLQAVRRAEGPRALAELVVALVPADEVRDLQAVGDKPFADDAAPQGEDSAAAGSAAEDLGAPAVVEDAAAIPPPDLPQTSTAPTAPHQRDDELPAPPMTEVTPAGIDLLETRLGQRLAAIEQLVRDRRKADAIASDGIRASLAGAVAQLDEKMEQRLAAAVTELTARLDDSAGVDDQRTNALATDLQAAVQEIGARVVEVDQHVARLAQQLASESAARAELAQRRDTEDTAGAGIELAVEVLTAELTSVEARLTELARKSAAEREQHQEALAAAVREGVAHSEARLEGLQAAVAGLGDRAEQAVRAVVLEALSDVGARVDAVQSAVRASVGDAVAKLDGDVA
ncbi:MAG TPA: hypothetical protein VM287_00495, partial [Egibacteraceae bacterium]|nr:hypothetical protein [Egibacteraceae bacterium]